MSISNRTRFAVLKRDGFACHYCGKRAPGAILEVDHIQPRSKGGSDDEGNLIAACFECNRGKNVVEILPERYDLVDKVLQVPDALACLVRSKKATMEVLIACVADVDLETLRTTPERFTDEEWEGIRKASERLWTIPLYVREIPA